MPTESRKAVMAAAAAFILVIAANTAWCDSALGPVQLVEIATEMNPQVRAARDRWYSATHQIKQNYAPADPILGYANLDSATNGFTASFRSHIDGDRAISVSRQSAVAG